MTTSQARIGRIWYTREDGTIIYNAGFNVLSGIPFYRGADPIIGPYTIHIEWKEDGAKTTD